MECTFIGVILLSKIITVSTVGVIPLHNSCVEGEPLPGDSQPDLNITVQPSLTIPEMSPITITCDADIPRFPANVSDPPNPPVMIMIHIGAYKVEECESVKPINQCRYELSSFFPDFPRRITCTAINGKGECRFKSLTVNLTPPLEDTTTKQPTINMTTATTSTNVPTSANTPQRNVTTSVPTEEITNAPTTPSTENITTPNPKPATPSSDGNGNTRTPVSRTTEVIPPIPTRQTTPGKKEDDDDDDESTSGDEKKSSKRESSDGTSSETESEESAIDSDDD